MSLRSEARVSAALKFSYSSSIVANQSAASRLLNRPAARSARPTKYARCRSRTASASPAAVSCSEAYSRTVSSITNLLLAG